LTRLNFETIGLAHQDELANALKVVAISVNCPDVRLACRI
jgi:hypothetical protein